MAFTTGNDLNILQAADSLNVGAGEGNDTYILAANKLGAGQSVTITDTQGINTLQLIGGLTITSSKVAADTVQLILSNGATVTILGAKSFNYEIGGNPLMGLVGTSQTFQQFVTTSLGATMPTGAIVNNGAANVAVNADGTTSASPATPSTPTTPTTPASLATTAAGQSKVDSDIGTLLPASNTSIMSLDSGEKWASTSLTYSFNTSIPAEYSTVTSASTPTGTLTSGWSALNETEKGVVRQAISNLASLVPISFMEVAGNAGDLRFNVIPTSGSTTGFAYYPAADWPVGGDVFLASSSRTKYSYTPGDHAVLVATHEIGHAMGLKHPFEAPEVLDSALDDYTHTMMSYTAGRSMLLDFTYSGERVRVQGNYAANPSDFSLLDVAALQAMYGGNTSTRTGADTYSVSFADHKYLTIWDAGGTDTLNCASAIGSCTVDLRAGQFSSMDVRSIVEQQAETQAYYHSIGVNWADSWVAEIYADRDYTDNLYTGENNVAIAHGVWLENVSTGSAADTIRDNAVNNTIIAGAGNDLIRLLEGGFDTVEGGLGTDTVQVTNTFSQLSTEKLSDGSYLVVGTYFAAKLIGVEKLLMSDGEMVLA